MTIVFTPKASMQVCVGPGPGRRSGLDLLAMYRGLTEEVSIVKDVDVGGPRAGVSGHFGGFQTSPLAALGTKRWVSPRAASGVLRNLPVWRGLF